MAASTTKGTKVTKTREEAGFRSAYPPLVMDLRAGHPTTNGITLLLGCLRQESGPQYDEGCDAITNWGQWFPDRVRSVSSLFSCFKRSRPRGVTVSKTMSR